MDKVIQGNAQPLNALISVPFGWKRMGDICVGDEVMTPFGTITTVTGVYPKGVRRVYRITLSDGSVTEACDQHLWQIERWKSAFVRDRKTGKCAGKGPNGHTCRRVSEVIDTMELKQRVDMGTQINLPKIEPVSYPTADLPIDPYVLGVILGDCHVEKNGVVKFTCADAELVGRVREHGYEVVDDMVHGERKDGIGYRINGVGRCLKELGLINKRSWEKFIPDVYLYADIEQRLDLLRGLMDTDGTISDRNEMEFCSASEQLAVGVQQLVRSLGGRVAVHVKSNVTYTAPNQLTKKWARTAYRVQNIRLFDLNPFLLTRKAVKWKPRTDRSGNLVVSVEYVRDDAVQCIRVADERHLYLTDDYIPTHNTSNIVFLKSTDDSMIETLSKMSGKTHRVYRDSKTVTKDSGKLFWQNEDKVTYTMTAREENTITYNDMAFISERNSIVLRAGDSPIWNRNETILPMSWRLFQDTIIQPGKEYTLQTIPTLSSVLDFDVRKNQPDFIAMWEKRMGQARYSEKAADAYKKAYGYRDYDIEQLDPDVYADDIMEVIEQAVLEVVGEKNGMSEEQMLLNEMADVSLFGDDELNYTDNEEQAVITAKYQAAYAKDNMRIYAGGKLSRNNLATGSGVNHQMDQYLIRAYLDCKAAMQTDTQHFRYENEHLYDASGRTMYLECCRDRVRGEMDTVQQAAKDPNLRVYTEDEKAEAGVHFNYEVKDAFYRFLVSLPDWSQIANGKFETAMSRLLET